MKTFWLEETMVITVKKEKEFDQYVIDYGLLWLGHKEPYQEVKKKLIEIGNEPFLYFLINSEKKNDLRDTRTTRN